MSNESVTINQGCLELVKGDITNEALEAIANAANSKLAGGGGVDGAIHRAAGPSVMAELREKYPDGCPTGQAVITGAGRLAAKHIIHAVGPVYFGKHTDAQLLASAYDRSLRLCREHGIHSVAFPSLSTGAYGYPLSQAAAIAVQTIAKFFQQHTDVTLVRFAGCRPEMSQERDPTRRFEERVGDYVRYRPGYPPAVLDFCVHRLGLTPSAVLADIGSGTGKLTELFLKNGNVVYGIEPNRKMREAAEALLRDFSGFRSVAGSAEATRLDDGSVDYVLAAQAFHWFRIEDARRELSRILRGQRWAILIWNRRTETSPFLRDYENLLQRLSVDYSTVDHRKTTDCGVLSEFFDRQGQGQTRFPNEQVLDWTGLAGRVRSSSYVPLPGHPGHDPLLRELRRIFDIHQRDGVVRFEYETELYWGRLD